MKKRALITGAAGFIGSHVSERLLAEGWQVTGVDNFDAWYDPAWKRANVASLQDLDFRLVEIDIQDEVALKSQLTGEYDVIVHLAAKGGVRPSIEDPTPYYDVNVRGTQNVLDLARERGVPQFVFASSGSVYGVNPQIPWREDAAMRPISPYACTKASGELLGHVHSYLYGMRFIALRFFNVYGPRQRPDAAVHRFAEGVLAGTPVPVFGDGTSRRDYIFVHDIVAGVRAAMDYTGSLYEAINLGSGRDISVMELIHGLERVIGKEARVEWLRAQPGEVSRTCGDMSKARELLGVEVQTELEQGLRQFVDWLPR